METYHEPLKYCKRRDLFHPVQDPGESLQECVECFIGCFLRAEL